METKELVNMETKEPVTIDMAEDNKTGNMTSVVSLPATKEEGISVSDGIVGYDQPECLEEDDNTPSGTSVIGDNESESAENSAIKQLQVYKALQTYALANAINLNAQRNADGDDAEDSDEDSASNSGHMNSLMVAQSYVNMALYRHMLSNTLASQSPYMSLAGALLTNRQNPANDTDRNSPDAQTAELTISKVATDAVTSLMGENCNQNTSKERETLNSDSEENRTKKRGVSVSSLPGYSGIEYDLGEPTYSEIMKVNKCSDSNKQNDLNKQKSSKKFQTSATEVLELEKSGPSYDSESDGSVMMPETEKLGLKNTFAAGKESSSDSFTIYDMIPKSTPRGKYKKRQKDEGFREEKKYSCNICDKRFKLEASVAKHTWLHTGEQPFQCNICEKKFTERSNLTTHMKIHTGEKPHVCEICGRRFTQQASLMYHTRSHTGEKPYQCNICKKTFVSSSGLNSHMVCHSADKPYNCDVCNNRFARRSGLELHMRVHTGEKPFVCKECGKEFTQKGALTSHEKLHTGDRRFHCEVCGKSFVENCVLKVHMRIHSGATPFQCDLCAKKFLHRTSYIEHMKVHNDERTFPCSVCGKLFRNKSSVNTHMVTHTKERPHECHDCGKTFALKSNLKHHMKIHAGKKEFVCEICGQAFMFKEHLKEHTKKHTGEKTFNCQICGKGYMWKPSFLRHMDEIHNLNPEDNLEAFLSVRGRYRDTFHSSGNDNLESVIVGAEESKDSEDERTMAFEFVETVDDLACASVESSSENPGNDEVGYDVGETDRKVFQEFNMSSVDVKEEIVSEVVIFEHEGD